MGSVLSQGILGRCLLQHVPHRLTWLSECQPGARCLAFKRSQPSLMMQKSFYLLKQ